MKKALLAIILVMAMITGVGCTKPEDEGVQGQATGQPISADALPSIEPAPSTQPASSQSNIITANATGEYYVTPDVAYVTIGMTTSGESADEVQKTNDNAMKGILDAIKNQGVAESDIRTAEYSVYPEYNYSGSRTIIKGYTAVNRAMVTINDVSKIGTVLEAANKAGANDIGNISLSVKDRNSAYDIALADAIKAARNRAQVMADASGVKLGGLVSVTDSGYSTPYLERSYDMMAGMSTDDSGTSSAAGISTGELKITATAVVIFEII